MPRIAADVNKTIKRWLQERARREGRSEAQVIRRIMDDAVKAPASADAPSLSPEKET